MVKEFVCRDCGVIFEFNEGEQRFYREHNLYDPARCKKCREINKVEKKYADGGEGSFIPGAPRMKSPSMYRAITWMCCVNGAVEDM